ncbi:MAG TPA: DMT family transporter, partial [Anaerolineales bacterium]|nr:DMT family transporter [Anaerolineales bacterium]
MESPKRPAIPPFVAILFGILAVSTASIFIRFAQKEATSLVIAAWRLTIASIILIPIASSTHKRELTTLNRSDLLMALLSGFFLALHFATWITSLQYTTVASSVVLVSTIPLWVALLSPFAIKEPIRKAVFLGLILALVGGAVVGISDSCRIGAGRLTCPSLASFIHGQAFIGDILAVCGAIAGAGYLLIGRRLRVKMSLVSYISLVYGMAAVVLVIIMFSARENPFGYSPVIYLWLTLLAIIPQLIGHSTFNWALGYLSAAYVSITLLGEPIGSTILAYFILNEKPTSLKLIGGVL